MEGKVLIVEDEPIDALDLKEELEALGCAITGLVGSVDDALMSIEENRPDLALMDIRIDGSRDGIQSAALLRNGPESNLPRRSEQVLGFADRGDWGCLDFCD
jgi:CheY-like chemotaxis protein